MPVYQASRSYTELVRMAVGDAVRVEAESEAKARQLIKSNQHEEVVDGSMKTGHATFTSEIVEGPTVDSIAKVAESPSELE